MSTFCLFTFKFWLEQKNTNILQRELEVITMGFSVRFDIATYTFQTLTELYFFVWDRTKSAALTQPNSFMICNDKIGLKIIQCKPGLRVLLYQALTFTYPTNTKEGCHFLCWKWLSKISSSSSSFFLNQLAHKIVYINNFNARPWVKVFSQNSVMGSMLKRQTNQTEQIDSILTNILHSLISSICTLAYRCARF